MSPVVVLAIVVATHEVDDQVTEAMRATAAEAIGGEDSVVVREVEVPNDEEALRVERRVHAHTSAEIVWLDGARTRARVRVHIAENNRWTERAIAFAAVDTPTERGRALGFAVTSMLPEEALAANPHRAPPRGAGDAARDAAALRTSFRFVAIGATGLGGTAAGVGGSIAGEFFLSPAMAVRLGFGGREGAVPGVDGTDLAGQAGLGLLLRALRPSAEHPVSVSLRGDLLALYHSVSHASPGRITVLRQAKWLKGFDALAEVGWSFTDALELVIAGGVEVALGGTDIQIDGMTVATIPQLRVVGETGLRLSF